MSFCAEIFLSYFKLSVPSGRFHVKGPRKKVNVKKWIFFDEMLKIIGQIDDFDRFLTTLAIWGCF